MQSTNSRVLLLMIVLLVLAGATYAAGYLGGSTLSLTPSGKVATSTEATSTASGGTAGAHCGGFIANAPTCAAGYHCQLKVSMPDTGGVCIPDQQGIAPYQSGVAGKVLLGPTCPAEQNPPQPQCADKGYATSVSVSHRGSSSIFAITESAADGSYAFSLPPGDYTLSAKGGRQLPRCASVDIIVGPAGYLSQNISCDTGIR